MGRKQSEATKEKIRIANTGRVFTDEWRKNLSLAHKGQVSWRKGRIFVPLEVQKERRLKYIIGWKKKNRERMLKLNRNWYARNVEKMRSRSRKFYWANREKELSRVRFKKYGILPEEYYLRLKKQDFKCAVCEGRKEKNLSVDHDHRTGKVRGIICNSCNMALGNAGDSPSVLRKLADYLEKYANTTT